MSRAQWVMQSVVGPLHLVAGEKGLQGIYWKAQRVPMAESLDSMAAEIRILAQAKAQLEEYLCGQRKEFDLPLDAEGTEFQRRVWDQLSRIPYGKTVSYREIAVRIQRERAVRAVGSANGRNPLGIVVPCHRVIASDGSLGGYSGGLELKEKLLQLERTFSLKS